MTTTSKFTIFKRILTIAVALAIGVAIVVNFVSKKEPPARIAFAEKVYAVRFIEVAELPLTIEARGFGTSTPAQSWSAISNVKGHVIYRHDDLESGAVLSAGTLLLEIDPEFYQLALAEVNADIASINAEITQINQEATNTAALLDLEQQRLALAEADLKRTQDLVAANAVAQTQLDVQLRATLQQRQAVQALVNQQSILPIQLTRLDAQKERALSRRLQIEGDLEDTKIVAPFDMRVGEVNIEMYQYVNAGQKLFTGDGVEAAEVALQFPMANLRRVLAELPTLKDELDLGALSAQVQLVGEAQSWNAEVVRIANGIDPATRTVRVTLRVQQPETLMNPIENPPLPKGAYVEGALRVSGAGTQMILPQEALHEGWVYLVDTDQRLQRREVEVAFLQNGLAVIQSGLQSGDKVVIDDISPAISGALLDAKRDLEAEADLANNAMGASK